MAGSAALYFPVKKAAMAHFQKKRERELLFQFKEMLQMAATALKAGYAMENAFVQAREEFVRLYGEKSIMAEEFAYINHQVRLNVTLESLLEDLADTTFYGTVLRAKGMLPSPDGAWLYFDLTPGEYEIREGSPEYTGRLCVIGSDLKEDKLKKAFHLE